MANEAPAEILKAISPDPRSSMISTQQVELQSVLENEVASVKEEKMVVEDN